MYSGTTFRNKSGRFMGVHQRIDRLARHELTPLLHDGQVFPTIHEILHFEGLNGPDGIKRKSPGKDEPWHYVDPTNPNDNGLRDMMSDHVYNLSIALSGDNKQRAAFEAAWLAHAITDGLTPAHHYPLEEKLEELRGEGLETRTTRRKKLLLPGETRRHQIKNNWEFWGAKGIMTTHFGFEMGIATTLSTGRIQLTVPSSNDIVRMRKDGFMPLFDESLQRIALLKLYEEYYRVGWTRRLAKETKAKLLPEIVRMVILAWFTAYEKARSAKGE